MFRPYGLRFLPLRGGCHGKIYFCVIKKEPCFIHHKTIIKFHYKTVFHHLVAKYIKLSNLPFKEQILYWRKMKDFFPLLISI